jgi:hypothetical protein
MTDSDGFYSITLGELSNLLVTILIAYSIYRITKGDVFRQARRENIIKCFDAIISLKYAYSNYKIAFNLHAKARLEGRDFLSDEKIFDLLEKVNAEHSKLGVCSQLLKSVIKKNEIVPLLDEISKILSARSNSVENDEFANLCDHACVVFVDKINKYSR